MKRIPFPAYGEWQRAGKKFVITLQSRHCIVAGCAGCTVGALPSGCFKCSFLSRESSERAFLLLLLAVSFTRFTVRQSTAQSTGCDNTGWLQSVKRGLQGCKVIWNLICNAHSTFHWNPKPAARCLPANVMNCGAEMKGDIFKLVRSSEWCANRCRGSNQYAGWIVTELRTELICASKWFDYLSQTFFVI